MVGVGTAEKVNGQRIGNSQSLHFEISDNFQSSLRDSLLVSLYLC
jgi:hypothetical protein